jgi:short-subunit dehydrogenase
MAAPSQAEILMSSGAIVLITGGSSGIGKRLAWDLLDRGDNVVIVSHDESRLRHAEQELRTISPHVRAMRCDVRSVEDVQRAVDLTHAEFGRIDVLVNNAGYAVYRPFAESSVDEVLDLVDVNLLGVLRFMKAVIPVMKTNGGHIVNVSSIAGTMIITPNSSYCASKHGVVAVSEALRYELEPFGISVSVVCPGRVETSFFDHDTFRARAARPETRLTVPVETVSAAIIDAIETRRFMTYVPRSLGVMSWAFHAAPWVVKPLYHRLMRRRIRSLYASAPQLRQREEVS